MPWPPVRRLPARAPASCKSVQAALEAQDGLRVGLPEMQGVGPALTPGLSPDSRVVTDAACASRMYQSPSTAARQHWYETQGCGTISAASGHRHF
eukprot:4749230-Prymnesium_polylepis.1